MASYIVKCPSTELYRLNITRDTYSKGVGVSDGRTFDYISFLKLDNSPLNNKKRKKILSIGFVFDSSWVQNISGVRRYGGTIAALKNTFTLGNISDTAEQIVFYAKYGEEPSSEPFRKPRKLNLEYYNSDSVGIYGEKIYRSFFEQLPVGFVFANAVPLNERKSLDWGDGEAFVEFYLSDFDTISPFAPTDGTYLNPTTLNDFVVSFDAFESIEHPTVTQAQVEIRNVATSAVTPLTRNMSVNLRGRNTVDIPIPANTMQKNTDYQWRAKLIHNDGETGWTDWADFTTAEAIPNAPIIKSPQSAYLDAAQPVTLTWEHDIDTGSTQYAYDLAYKQNGDWVTLANHLVSAAQSRIIPANTLTAGSFVWRVRTYNRDDIPGPYAESATNVVQAPPQRPVMLRYSGNPAGSKRGSCI